MMSTGGAVGQERHVLDREDLGDDALVAVAAGQLVALGDLALLGHVDPHQLVHARRQLVGLLAGEDADVDDLAVLAVGHLERGVAHLAGLLAEDGAQQALLGRLLGLTLGGDLAHEHVARLDLGADADDAALVEVGQDLLGEVRDVPGDLLGAELGVAGVDLVLLDVDRRQHVVAHQALREDDGVLVVVALPRHEGDEQVLAERQLAVVRRGAVGQQVADDHALPLGHQGAVVDARVLVGAAELGQPVDLAPERGAEAVLLARGVLDGDGVAADLGDGAVALGQDDVAGVAGGTGLDAGADVRRLGHDQRHGLLLHVGAHEGPVGVVVLDEGDQRGRDRDDLLRRDVHEVHLGRRHEVDLRRGAVGAVDGADAHAGALRAAAHEDAVLGEATLGVDRGVGLGDDVLLFLVGGQVADLVGHLAVDDRAVRRLDEAVLVDPGVRGQGADEADVRALGRLDRAHAAVVRRVDVSHLEAGALTREATWPEGRQAALVGQARQRVVLVHELAQLRWCRRTP